MGSVLLGEFFVRGGPRRAGGAQLSPRVLSADGVEADE